MHWRGIGVKYTQTEFWEMIMMKTGVVDVGGGLRGVYAAGALDRCIDEGITFDLGIGVSAGSANLASFFAGQRGRNLTFYRDYSSRKEYMSAHNMLKKRSYLDLDYIYGTLSAHGGENPLDFDALMANPAGFLVVASDAETGETVYFDKSDLRRDDYGPFKASSAIPVVCHPYEAGGRLCYDGALGDPVPVAKALELGCERIVLLLTKPSGLLRLPDRDEKLASRLQKKHPAAAARLRLRAENYNRGVAFAKELAAKGRALIISPDDTCGVDTLTKDKAALTRLYEKGYADAAAIAPFLAAGR